MYTVAHILLEVHIFHTNTQLEIILHINLTQYLSFSFSAKFNETWSLLHNADCEVLYSYDRPVYTLTHIDDAFKMISVNDVLTLQDADLVNLVFAGSRWFIMRLVGGRNLTLNELQQLGSEFHAFWDEAYDTSTIVVSDISTASFPVGVDFYRIGE